MFVVVFCCSHFSKYYTTTATNFKLLFYTNSTPHLFSISGAPLPFKLNSRFWCDALFAVFSCNVVTQILLNMFVIRKRFGRSFFHAFLFYFACGCTSVTTFQKRHNTSNGSTGLSCANKSLRYVLLIYRKLSSVGKRLLFILNGRV